MKLSVLVHGYNPVLGRLKQEESELEANLGYKANPWAKTKRTNPENNGPNELYTKLL